jgi:hypothetical protein
LLIQLTNNVEKELFTMGYGTYYTQGFGIVVPVTDIPKLLKDGQDESWFDMYDVLFAKYPLLSDDNAGDSRVDTDYRIVFVQDSVASRSTGPDAEYDPVETLEDAPNKVSEEGQKQLEKFIADFSLEATPAWLVWAAIW